MKYLSTLAIVLSLSACQQLPLKTASGDDDKLPEGIRLIDEQPVVKDKLAISYRKFELDNGLTVVLHEDHSDPLVHVDVTYHVGSSREEPGRSGFAHFFEHMMFQGSENVADEQHFKLVTEAGGSMNGTTNNDRTNYYQTVPANQLEKMLWLEADRMGYLLDAVTQEKFEVQRETVKNERAQRVDNQPYGLRQERISEALFPKNHPYSWPVIGYIDDLNRVDVNDLKAFFARWYGPNNAVLTIGGNIDEAKTLAWVKKYFGNIPTGQEVTKLPKTPVTLESDRYLTIEDDVHLPLLQLTFPTVHARHEDEAPLDVLSNILGGGKTSLFYKNLVKDGFAVHAGVGHPCIELACSFELISLPNPQRLHHLKDLEQRVRDTLVEFEERGVLDDDIERVKAYIRAGTIFGLQSVAGKVSTLAYNETFTGSPDQVQYDLERYAAVTKEDVMRVFRKYIKNKASVVLSIVPSGQIAIQAKEPNFEPPQRDISPTKSGTFSVSAVPKADDFDRSVMPVQGPNPVVKVPDYWETAFANGVSVLGHQSEETPTVSLTISLEGGPLLDPIEKAGLAAFTAAMMQESTENYSNEAISNELDKLGSRISISAAGRFSFIQVSTLAENVDATLKLLQEKLFRPAFLEADFVRMQQRTIQSLQQSDKNPQVLASRAVTKVLYGEKNRISLPDSGTVASISAITLDDVKSFYERYYNGAKASAIIVGSFDKESMLSKLKFLEKWDVNDYSIPSYKAFPTISGDKIYVVDDPSAQQTIVKMIKPSLPYDATGEGFKTKLMNFPLGGMFNSRVNLNLREDKGYTYGARTSFMGGKTLGRFEASAAVNKQHTVAALNEFMMEFNKYREHGMTDSELAFMRNAYTQGDALKYETPGSKAGFLRQLSIYQLESDYTEKQNEIIRSISVEELNQLANQHINVDTMAIILVADMATLGEELQQFATVNNRELVLLSSL